jgi:hypothetical protein
MRCTRELTYVERFAVARVDQVSRAEEMAGRRDGRHHSGSIRVIVSL